MNNTLKYGFMVFLVMGFFFLSFTSVSAVSDTGDSSNLTDNLLSINVVDESLDSNHLIRDDSNLQSFNPGTVNVLGQTDIKNFTDLNSTINSDDPGSVNIILSGDIVLSDSESDNFKEGIFINKTVVIDGNDFSIDANGLTRIFNVSGTGNLTLRNVHLINGFYNYGGLTNFNVAGAILNNGTCKLVNCTFVKNKSPNGGAIFSFTPLIVDNCTFINNTAFNGQGGAIYIKQNMTVESNSYFWGNNATGGSGGAIYQSGDESVNNTILIKDNCTFKNNIGQEGGAIRANDLFVGNNCNFTNNSASSSRGGAIYNQYGNITIGDNCKFLNNSSPYQGGAIFLTNNNLFIGDHVEFINNKITGNAVGAGASIFTDAANITIGDYVLFMDNNANAGYGGAIGTFFGKHLIIGYNSQFINNSGSYGGAIYSQNVPISIKDNCNFIKNSATYWGGCIFLNSGYMVFGENSNLINNTAGTSGGAIRTNGNVTIGNGSQILFNKINGKYAGAILANIIKMNYCMIIGNTANSSSTTNAIYVGDKDNSNLENNWWGHNISTVINSPLNCNYTNNDQINSWLILTMINNTEIITGDNTITIDLLHSYNNVSESFTIINGSKLPQNVNVILTTSNNLNNALNTTLINGIGETIYTVNSGGDDILTSTIYINSTSISFKNKLSTIVICENIQGHPKDKVNIKIKLTDSMGDPVSEGSVVTIIGGVTYTANVINGEALFIDVILPGDGYYTYKVDYEDKNGLYSMSNGSGNINVNKIDTIVNVSDIIGHPGDIVNVTVKVTDKMGDPVSEGSVVTIIGGVTYTANVINGEALFIDVILPGDGYYTYKVDYEDKNGLYSMSNGSGNINVNKIDTIVNVSDIIGHPGDIVNVTVKVTDKMGDPVSEGSVVTIIGGVTYTANVINGEALFIDVILPGDGYYTYKVDYTGSEYYNPSINTLNITVNKIDTIILNFTISGHPGDIVNLTINVTDNEGNPILKGIVTTIINNVTYIANVTNGKAILTSVSLPSNSDYNCIINYTDGDNYYSSSNGKININITKLNVIIIPIGNITGKPNENITITINVTDQNGKPVRFGNITISLPNGSNITIALINGTGNISFLLPENSGNYTLNIKYNENEYYFSANITVPIKVIENPKPQPQSKPDINLKPKNININNDYRLESKNKNYLSENSISMKNTGNPIFTLLLILIVLSGLIPFNKHK